MKICGFFWKCAATAMVGMLFCTARKSPIMSPPMIELDLAGDQQHAAVRRRPALQNGDVEPVFRVSPVDQGLIVAAGLRVGDPIGAEGHLVESEGRPGESDRPRQRRHDRNAHSNFLQQSSSGGAEPRASPPAADCVPASADAPQSGRLRPHGEPP